MPDRLKIKLLFQNNSRHLQQIYTGFSDLAEKQVIDLSVCRQEPFSHDALSRPVLHVVLNGKITIAYDAMDGYDYLPDTEQQNMAYLDKQLESVDFYFKRSYRSCLPLKNSEKIFPLGLYYHVSSSNNFAENAYMPGGGKAYVKRKVNENPWINNILKRLGYVLNTQPDFPYAAFEYPPALTLTPNIIFVPRLWDPFKVKYEKSTADRFEVNEMRIELVIKLKQEFPEIFMGGIISDDPTIQQKYPEHVIMDVEKKKRLNYIKSIHRSMIGINTRGLHKSIGNKVAEYVAASKCIVTEPFAYEVPGDFQDGKNYLSFDNIPECIEQIKRLLNDEELRFRMMKRNYNYYHNFVRPDMLILNSLHTVINQTGFVNVS